MIETLITALAMFGLKGNDEIDFEGRCDFCNRPGEKATRKNLEGISFLNPDFKWICESCLKREMQKEAIMASLKS